MKGVVHTPTGTIKHEHVELDSDTVLGVLEVTPTNLAVATEDQEHALHSIHQSLFDTISYPVALHSRQSLTTLEGYVDRFGAMDSFPTLREAYLDYCQGLAESGLIQTTHSIVVRVSTNAYTDPVHELDRRLTEVQGCLSGGALDVTHLAGQPLTSFVRTTRNTAPVPTQDYCATPSSRFNEYRKLLYVDAYPAALDVGWPVSVLQVDGLVDVTQVVRPVPVDQAVRKLRRYAEKMDAEITAFRVAGYRGVNRLRRGRADAEWFLDLLAGQVCQPVKAGVYITAHGLTEAAVADTLNRVRSQLRALGIEAREPGFRNDYAYYADAPLHEDRLDETLLMPSLSAATGFPFGTQPLETETGVLYGIDTANDTPIILNRYAWDSHSTVVTGTLGSGKSYFTKLELIRSLLAYPDLRIIVVDPKREYRSVVEALGGTQHTIAPGSEYQFDRPVLGFEPPKRGEFETVEALVELVQQLYTAVSTDPTRTLVVIDEASRLLTDEVGRHVLHQFILEARDITTAVHMVSQSESHFRRSEEGTDILAHVPGKLYFRQEERPDQTSLSPEEAGVLLELKSGKKAGMSEALLHVADHVHTRITIESTDLEHRVIEAEPVSDDQHTSLEDRE